ncbi:AraC family transcriptional regulator, regulatory protein of adaptative response / methylated-DNA-[protein]-cysteine methyltransferase [Aquimarina amphilecti]|uniref:methylated-DNA--[protein]-cysteine S-methyltransferase n=1 Tax=Aquimarina amphilecti TaxID=1038014 RepID=A0A1H7UW63_AQUAM|nr:methylated-DNA--[protein]-cysteine S-methyltransferase [Aquimarina amphilecti]SEM00717.1 AraC family transcriptional regulator, regulatory protein of adaptative response / methylated-DNA-[protein]-cysteine methyltransferase [Aquimarina amphilecti]
MLITENSTIELYYEALLERKESFVGIFFVGVKTTSVFCIATCRARKPKLQNVEFYTSFKEALDNGYRPCKICKPTENANEAPDQVEKAIALVQQNPKEKITDDQLRELAISPELVRRWFNKNYGMTFQSYQRMYRINNAFQELKKGKNATHTAFDMGYESLSGFGYTFKKVIGSSPKKSTDNTVILISRLTTPLGPMFICATENGVCLLEFVDRRMLEAEFEDLQKRLNATILAGSNKHIKRAKKEVTEYFEGKRKVFDVLLETPGTEFQNIVWNSLLEIQYGEKSTYKKQAERIYKPTAIRAVASANGCNRIAILIPCHRVIGKDGSMTGYSGGIERKKWLLSHEEKNL